MQSAAWQNSFTAAEGQRIEATWERLSVLLATLHNDLRAEVAARQREMITPSGAQAGRRYGG